MRRIREIISSAVLVALLGACSDTAHDPLAPQPVDLARVVSSTTSSIEQLGEKVASYQASGDITSPGVANGLTALLGNARAAAGRGDVQATENMLGAFTNRVRAQRGKHIGVAAADDMNAAAQRIIDGNSGEDVPAVADLGVVLTVAERVTAGEDLALAVTVENSGPAAVRELRLTLLVAGSVDDVAAPAACVAESTVSGLRYECSIDALESGGQAMLDFTASALAGGETLSVQADIIDWTEAEDPVLDNNIATGTLYVNAPPVVNIDLPTTGSVFMESGEIRFAGGAEDLEDGRLAGENLVWTSDLAGELGTGEALSLSGLLAGTHSITLATTDAEGAHASATVRIEVAAAGSSLGASLNWEQILAPVSGLHTALTGVWEAGPTDIWAVGNACGLGYRAILRFDGVAWREEPHESACPTAVWGSAPDDVFVVATGGRIRHFDGTSWSEHLTGVTATLNAVWGSGPADVWAAGEGIILHYDGNAAGQWTVELSNAQTSTTLRISSLWGSSSADVYAAGPNANLWHFDGAGWSRVATGFNVGHLGAVWGTGADDVFAVGGYGMIAHWDGSTWTQQAAPPELTSETLHGVSGSASGNVYAVGTSGTIIQYDGTTWRRVAAGGPTIRAVSATRPDATFAVGSAAFVAQETGGRWKVHSANVTFADVLAVGSDDVFAVGVAPFNTSGLLLHYDGADWTLQNSDLTANDLRSSTFRALWGSSSSDVWAVGQHGRVLRYDGTRWARQNIGTTSHLEGVWGSPSGKVFVVGSGSTILEYDGGVWRTHAAPVQSSLQDVFGVSDEAIWAVGSGGAILHYDGNAWSAQRTGTEMLSAGWAVADNMAFVASSSATILRWDGSSWTTQANARAHSFWGSSPVDVFAASSQGQVLHFDGTNWAAQETPARHPSSSITLWGVSGASAEEVFAAGANGTVVRGVR